ncbi:hypothetical protein [Pseudomonas fluorescens]|uniref:Uncharacterized protein n=1 Tax=Pseudomonas fluorescens TaxID=294 RepID=A0A0F4VEN0_PSEFL|nr:hypothetical protein [Pseudomonas fluorescens]KJZ67246.1 hypothetical protein VD17_03005 [Pseudomonas fluorescens]
MNESMPELMRRLCFEHNQLRVPGSPTGVAWERAMVEDVAELIETQILDNVDLGGSHDMFHFEVGNALRDLGAGRKYDKAIQEAGINRIWYKYNH